MPDGTVWTAGGNSNGEVGDATFQTRLARVQVLSGATSVAVGANHTVAVVGGQVFGWGSGDFGQLCDPAAQGRTIGGVEAPRVSFEVLDASQARYRIRVTVPAVGPQGNDYVVIKHLTDVPPGTTPEVVSWDTSFEGFKRDQ